MKNIFFVCIALAISLSACKKDQVKPDPVLPTPTPVVVQPTPVPTATPVACPEAKAPTLVCYDWGNCNGLYADKESAMEVLMQKDPGGCSRIDGVVVKGGFGPCSECNTIGYKPKSLSLKSMPSKFDDVLKSRDGKTVIKK